MPASQAVRFFDTTFLDALSAEARQSPRLRKHFNLHASHAEPVQRLFNAIEPGSYVAPHRHARLPASENLYVVRGRLGLLVFDDAGQLTHSRILSAAGPCPGVELAEKVWHSLVSLEPGSVILEIKQGPFVMETAAERAPWAPEDGSVAAADWLSGMETFLSAADAGEPRSGP